LKVIRAWKPAVNIVASDGVDPTFSRLKHGFFNRGASWRKQASPPGQTEEILPRQRACRLWHEGMLK
jgi:hypothetical protein